MALSAKLQQVNNWSVWCDITDHSHQTQLKQCIVTAHWPTNVCMYVCIYLFTRHGYTKVYTVTMNIIVNSVKISSPIGTISNSEVVDLQ